MNPALRHSLETHPCFFAGAKSKFGRIHLPTARSCNIQCAYCRRDMACVNESRPGVSNGVVSPEGALARLDRALEEMPHISVAAVAGPGDAFCDADSTLETFRRIREKYPALSLCVSTNGLNLPPHIHRLKELNVGFVTVTVNALDPGLGARLVDRVHADGKVVTGTEAAALLIRRQLESITRLKEEGFVVKANTVVVPEINGDHVLFVAKQMGRMGVDLMNLIPLIPVEGTALEKAARPTREMIKRLRNAAGRYLPQMSHCARCRADAMGCIGAG